jgi:hypothetical protein
VKGAGCSRTRIPGILFSSRSINLCCSSCFLLARLVDVFLSTANYNLQVDLYQGSDENMFGKIQVAKLSLSAFASGSLVKAEMRSKLNVSLLDYHSDLIKGYIEPFANKRSGSNGSTSI